MDSEDEEIRRVGRHEVLVGSRSVCVWVGGGGGGGGVTLYRCVHVQTCNI